MQQEVEPLIDRLVELGFSKYEARAYVGLLGSESVTGYALANSTGIPQPKVYETLRRLADRGAAIKVSDDPALYAALPAERLLEELQATFRERLDAAKGELQRARTGTGHEWHEPVLRMDGYDAVRARAERMIAGTQRKLYVSGWAKHLADLREPIQTADARGVEIVALHFGKPSFAIEHGESFRHASTEGALYPRHRSRQLAVVSDSASTLWALAPDGDDWGGVYSEDRHLITVVKAYVRHDIYVQKIYERLGDQMHEVFGPGLEYLADVSSRAVLAGAEHDAVPSKDKRAAS